MASTIDTIYALWLREIKRYLKSKSRVVGSGGQPLIWLALFGVGFGSVFTLAGGASYLTFMAPGIMGMTLLFSSIFSGVNVIWDKQFGFMKEILVAPVSRVGIVLGKIAGSASIAMMNTIIVLIIIVIFGVLPLSHITVPSVVLTLIFMALISFVFISIGLLIASTVNNVEGFQVIINFLVMPLFFLSGAIFPITSKTPIWMQAISVIDPLRYGVDGMRSALLGTGGSVIYLDLAIMFVVAVAFVLVADWAFKRMQAK
ncbi:MAG: ABC transporter permease [Candidatus Micrarchaeota archaeon]|nr:ABC transporter permease [Candidatus Micrarchaeota archaeon]